MSFIMATEMEKFVALGKEIGLEQGWANYGPRVACGPPNVCKFGRESYQLSV